MKSHLLPAIAVAWITIGLLDGYTLHAQSVPLPDCRVWGRQLEEEYILDLRLGKKAEAASELAPGFQSVRADGIRDRAGELPLIQGSAGPSGAIHSYKVTYSGDVAILTYQIRRRSTGVKGATIQNFGVLSVWKPTSNGWQCIARSETPMS